MTDRDVVDSPSSKTEPPASTRPPSCRFAITCEGHEVPLPKGKLILGRGSRCHIVVDDLLASREHARLTVTEDCVFVEDLGSTNGVYVNERRIQASTPLAPGDRLVVGTQELELVDKAGPPVTFRALDFADLATVLPRTTSPRTAAQQRLLDMDEPGMESPPPPRVEAQMATEKADVVSTLGRLADRMLSMGRFDAAERVLQTQLQEVLHGARCGRTVTPDVFETAVEYALRLAEVTHKATWVDYVVEMHMVGTRIMAGPVIARMTALMPAVKDRMNREVFVFYQESLRARRDTLSLADQVSCDRILKLNSNP
jgi:hypothetical protein